MSKKQLGSVRLALGSWGLILSGITFFICIILVNTGSATIVSTPPWETTPSTLVLLVWVTLSAFGLHWMGDDTQPPKYSIVALVVFAIVLMLFRIYEPLSLHG